MKILYPFDIGASYFEFAVYDRSNNDVLVNTPGPWYAEEI